MDTGLTKSSNKMNSLFLQLAQSHMSHLSHWTKSSTFSVHLSQLSSSSSSASLLSSLSLFFFSLPLCGGVLCSISWHTAFRKKKQEQRKPNYVKLFKPYQVPLVDGFCTVQHNFSSVAKVVRGQQKSEEVRHDITVIVCCGTPIHHCTFCHRA